MPSPEPVPFDIDGALSGPSPQEIMEDLLAQLRASRTVLFGPKYFPDPRTFVDFWNPCDIFIYCALDGVLEEFHKVEERINNSRPGTQGLIHCEPHRDVILPVNGGASIDGKLASVRCAVRGPERSLKIVLLRGDPAAAYSALFAAPAAAPLVLELFETDYDTEGFNATPLGQVVNNAEAKPQSVLQGASEVPISNLWPQRCARFRARPNLYTAFCRE